MQFGTGTMTLDQDPTWDLIVVGGGPAGLQAATHVAAAGARVLLIDENLELGGKLRGQLHEEPNHRGWSIGRDLAAAAVEAAVGASVQFQRNTVVWRVESEGLVYTHNALDGSSAIEHARAVLIATGAVEKSIPLAGWTMPGVMTIGAAQVLTNIHGVKPGARVLVCGVDVLSVTIARAMQIAGIEVVGIVLAPGVSTLDTLERLGGLAKLAPAWYIRAVAPLLRLHTFRRFAATLLPPTMRLWGLRLHLRRTLFEIGGQTSVEFARTARVGRTRRANRSGARTVAVDAVCLAGGLSPLNEILGPLGCEFLAVDELGGSVPLHGPGLQTALERIYVAGNAIGIESADMAKQQGTLVALSLIRDLGLREVTDEAFNEAVNDLATRRASMVFQFHPDAQRGHDRVAAVWEQTATR